MKLSKIEIAILASTAVFFIVGGLFYPYMPEVMASHWNAHGQADGYMSRFWGVFLFPLMAVGLAFLLVLIPRLDPLKANVEKFKKTYHGFIAVFLVYFLYIYVLSLLLNLGMNLDMIQLLLPAMALFLYFLGVLLGRAKRNWFIGIRTPWTLISDSVWDKTHRLGGILFKIAAALTLLGLVLPDWTFYFFLVPVLLVTVFTIVYSYLVYRQELKAGH